MNLFQKQQQTTNGYKTIPDAIADDIPDTIADDIAADAGTAAVLFGTTISDDNEDKTAVIFLGTTLLPPSKMTRGHRLSQRIAPVAGMLLVFMMAGGTIWLRSEGGSSSDDSSESLVMWNDGVVMYDNGEDTPCLPATDTFSGRSGTPFPIHTEPFQTCYQYGDTDTFCWSHAYYNHLYRMWQECVPLGRVTDPYYWHALDQAHLIYVTPISDPYSCRVPCQELYKQ